MSLFYTPLSRTSYYENSPPKNFFPTSRVTQEKEKSSTDELHTRFAIEFFLVLRVAQVKKAKGFFSDELHTRSRTWKPLSSARAGLSPQEGDVRRRKEDNQGRWSVATRRGRKKKSKEKDQGRQEGGSAKARFRVSSTKNFSFGSRVFGF